MSAQLNLISWNDAASDVIIPDRPDRASENASRVYKMNKSDLEKRSIKIRIKLEKISVSNLVAATRGSGEFSFHSCISFNEDLCRKYYFRIPERGLVKLSKGNSYTFKYNDLPPSETELILDANLFEGMVRPSDRMTFTLLNMEKDTFTSDEEMVILEKRFEFASRSSLGSFYSKRSVFENEEEKAIWKIWFSINEVK